MNVTNQLAKSKAVIVGVSALSLLATSCAGGEAGSSSNGVDQSPATAAGTACEGQSPGVSEDEVRIGAWEPKTGDLTIYNEITAGARAYFHMVNEEGGVNGRTIDYVTRDDSYDPSKTVSVAQRLVEDDNVFAIVGAVGSPTNAAVLDYMTEVGIPNVAPIAGGDVFTGEFRKNYFPLLPPYSVGAELLSRYAVEELGAESVALFYEDDEVGQPAVPAVKKVLSERGMELRAEIGYPPSEVNFSAHAHSLEESGADAVVAWAGTPGVTGVQKAAEESGYDPIWLAPVFTATPEFYELGGVEGTYFDNFMIPLPSDVPAAQTFEENLQEIAPDVAAGTLAEEGWIAADVFVEGLRRAVGESDCLTWDSFIQAMETFDGYDAGLAKGITYTSDEHPGITAEVIVRATDGSFEVVSEPIQVVE